MHLSDFDYVLPDELIARHPLATRTQSRLMYVARHGSRLSHHHFFDLPEFLQPGDYLVLNNTRVIPARLFGQKQTGGKIEILVERILNDREVLAHIRASKAPGTGTQLVLDAGIHLQVTSKQDSLYHLEFLTDIPALTVIETYGEIPVPLYFQRDALPEDQERYQTVFAKDKGSCAAPTAGLHFDQKLLDQLAAKGVQAGYVTLHVGAGTFQPVRVNNIRDHQMHAEYMEVSADVCEQIKKTKQAGGRVIAVGTTSVRALETAARAGEIQPYRGETRLFIYPGFEFHCVDAMITNLHWPKSSLLMLVCAFGGYIPMMQAYQEAVAQKYRFYSYGDAMFIG